VEYLVHLACQHRYSERFLQESYPLLFRRRVDEAIGLIAGDEEDTQVGARGAE